MDYFHVTACAERGSEADSNFMNRIILTLNNRSKKKPNKNYFKFPDDWNKQKLSYERGLYHKVGEPYLVRIKGISTND